MLTNGAARAEIERLHEQAALARARADLRAAEHDAALWEGYAPQQMTWPSPWDYLYPWANRHDDWTGRGHAGYAGVYGDPQARRGGANRPWVWTDTDLDAMRAAGRHLAARDPFGVAAVELIGDYTVKTGYEYEVRPSKHYLSDTTAQQLAAMVEEVVDEFRNLNAVESDGVPVVWADRERLTVESAVATGEAFLRVFPGDDGTSEVRPIEPEQVRQPKGGEERASFGVEVDPRDVERALAYHVAYDGVETEPVPASDVAHFKLNVPSTVKRGMSDFFACQEKFEHVAKLLRNMGVAGGVQAAIAWFEQYATATATQVGAQVAANRDINTPRVPHPVTGHTPNYKRYEPGSIPQTSAGKEIVPPPVPTGASVHIAIVQACLRSAAARWRMPEYMLSADASNANFASTLVAGAPFVIATECRQRRYGRFFVRVLWMAVRNAAHAGRFLLNGRRFTAAEVARLVDIDATPPAVAIANLKEQADIDAQDIASGVLSLQTRCARRGLDFEHEQKNIAAAPPTRLQGRVTDIDPQGNPVQGTGQQAGSGQVRQPVHESFDPNQPRDEDGKWTAGAAAAARKSLVASLVEKGGGAVAGLKAAAERMGKAAWSKMSRPQRKKAARLFATAKAVEHRLMVGFAKGKELAVEVARERGLDATHADRVGKIVAVADQALAWTTTFPVVTAVTGNPALGKVSSFLPVASLAYLAYSAARNPLAAYRAAGAVFSRKRKGHAVAAHESKAPDARREAVAALLEGFAKAKDPDLYGALISAALDANGYDLAAAARAVAELEGGGK